MGDLFRTRAFNFHARKAAPPRSLDTLTLRELYALKTETSNRALSAKMLSDIYKRLESIHVQSTCLINTPLITQCLQSPMVSRNAQLAKQHSPASNLEGSAKLEGSVKLADKLGGTLGGPGSLKSGGKDKGAGDVSLIYYKLFVIATVGSEGNVYLSARRQNLQPSDRTCVLSASTAYSMYCLNNETKDRATQ